MADPAKTFPFATLLAALVLPLAERAAAQDAAPPAAPVAPAAIDRLLVLNKGDASVSVFDPKARALVATVAVGTGPHEVAIAPDGRRAVVCNYGAQKPGSTLTVIDVAEAKALRTFDLARGDAAATGGDAAKGGQKVWLRPHGIQFLPDGDALLVTSEAGQHLLEVELPTYSVRLARRTPQQTMHMVALAPDASFAYATSIKEGNLAVFALKETTGMPAAEHVIATGKGAEGLAVDPKRGLVWVGNRAEDTVSVVDAKERKVVATLATAQFPFRVVFTPDGGKALVTCAEGDVLQVWDAEKRTLASSIAIGGDMTEDGAQPLGVCTDPEGAFAYVTCGKGDKVAVVDLAKAQVVDRLATRAGPDGIGYARVLPQVK